MPEFILLKHMRPAFSGTSLHSAGSRGHGRIQVVELGTDRHYTNIYAVKFRTNDKTDSFDLFIVDYDAGELSGGHEAAALFEACEQGVDSRVCVKMVGCRPR